jgi:regulator of replication initiation timing
VRYRRLRGRNRAIERKENVVKQTSYSTVTELTEQIAERKKQTAVVKAQVTRMKGETKKKRGCGKEVLRAALAVKIFELTEVQTKQKAQTEQIEQKTTRARVIEASTELRPRNIKM